MFNRSFCGIFLGVITILFILMLVIAFDGVKDDQKSAEEVASFSNSDSENNIYDYVDPDTGIHYLVFVGYLKGGITPRLNPDGSIMIEKEGAANESK